MSAFHLTAAARRAALAISAVATLAACGDDDDDDNDLTGPGETVAAGRTIFGIDATNNLVAFGAQNPTTAAARRIAITGLASGETASGSTSAPTRPRPRTGGSTAPRARAAS